MRGITPELVDMSKEILYPKFRVLQCFSHCGSDSNPKVPVHVLQLRKHC
jgi:hypothetical protein